MDSTDCREDGDRTGCTLSSEVPEGWGVMSEIREDQVQTGPVLLSLRQSEDVLLCRTLSVKPQLH